MKKQKTKIIISALFAMLFAGQVSASGNATISWTAPTTNEDTSALVDLAGYRIFYSTAALDCAAWDAAADAAARLTTPLASIAHVDVTEAATIRDTALSTKRGYTFSNSATVLTPGSTYNFTVVAYDSSSNYSKCVTDGATYQTASKAIFRSGNIKNGGLGSGTVGLADLSLLATDYGKTNWCRIAGHPTDIDGNCTVGLSDLSILATNYGL